MYLHNDKSIFEEVVNETSLQSGISQSIIEKDYYVTMILRLLAEKSPEIVFKGGTSLSKCFHLIDRFSEDIDITFAEHIGEARRKKLKYNILGGISKELGMPIANWNSIQSDRDYNYYLFTYQPVSDYPEIGVLPGIKLETALVSYSFPTEVKEVSSIIHDKIKEEAPDIIEEYNLFPFSMQVQSVSRTFIDKIYALCDYYLENKSKRYSRHLYDIYKLYPAIRIDDSFRQLAEQVREHRSQLPICPSAKEGTDVKAMIHEFLKKDFYKHDYENVTRSLISDDVTYHMTAERLHQITDELF